MDIFRKIAERRINEAVQRGEFENLSLAGQRLDLERDAHVPDDLKMAYRLLRNAGMVPEEVQLLRAVADLRKELADCPDPQLRKALQKDLNTRESHLNILLDQRRCNSSKDR
jgi:hypothetical protein